MPRKLKLIPNPSVAYLRKVVREGDNSVAVGVVSTAEGHNPTFWQITRASPNLSADELRQIADLMEE